MIYRAVRLWSLPVANNGRCFVRALHATAEKEAYLEYLAGEHQQGIAVLKLNRPAARNALSVKLLGEFRDALAELRFSK